MVLVNQIVEIGRGDFSSMPTVEVSTELEESPESSRAGHL